jgi:hypothetical protein
VPELRAHDVRATLPAGWDGRITVRRDGAEEALRAASGPAGGGPVVFTAQPRPVVHLANFALPEERADFGTGAVELMGDQDVLVVLFEYEPESVGQPMFAGRGMPRRLAASDFDPSMLRRGIAGQTGYQRFFQESGRAFCLYVVLGSAARRSRLVRLVNTVLADVRIDPRPAP